MPSRCVRIRRLLAVGVAALTLASLGACSTGDGSAVTAVDGGHAPPGAGPAPRSGTALDEPVPDAVTRLPLVDETGRQFTLADLRGKTVVIADFLTLCQEVCPLTSVDIQQADEAVTRAGLGGDVVFLEATVDPGRDDAARLSAYQGLFGAQPGWRFVTGTADNLATLWKFLGVYYAKTAEGPGPPPTDWLTGQPLTYDVEHQDVVAVLGPDGHLRWEDEGTADTHGQAPPKTLQRFLSSQGRANLASPAELSWSAEDVEQAVTYVTGRRVDAAG